MTAANKTIIERMLRDPIAQYPAATVACFDPTTGDLPRRRLDEGRTRAFLERLAGAGAPAALIAASTGQGHVRTVPELEAWYRTAALARLGDCVLMALLRPEDGAEANRRLAGLLVELGYAVAYVRPGRGLSGDADNEAIVANMAPAVGAAAEAGLAVGLYSIPDVSGVAMSPEVAARLVAGPGGERIVAIKVTEASYENSTLRFLREPRLARLKIVQGWDPHLARALKDGPAYDAQGRQRCGVTSGPMSFAVFQYVHLLEAAERGDWEEAAAAQAAVTSLFQAMQDDPTKFADLQRAKCIMGLGEPLTGEVTREQVERVLAALRGLPREADRERLARSLNLMEDGPFAGELQRFLQDGAVLRPTFTRSYFHLMSDSTTTVAELKELVRRFVEEREWGQFHAPKNLSMSLAIEAAELMEHFQWIDAAESRNVASDPAKLAAVGEEMADVLCYLLALANELNVDLAEAVRDKMLKNAAKYPAEKSRGRYAPPAQN